MLASRVAFVGTLAAVQMAYEVPSVALTSAGTTIHVKRILHGLWQTSGGWGKIDPPAAVASMAALVDSGFTTFDLADHYGPAEDLIGGLTAHYAAASSSSSSSSSSASSSSASSVPPPPLPFQALTKWVPRPGRVTRAMAEEAVNVSLRRMRATSLDSLQFHWWEYAMEKEMVEALRHLDDIRKSGKIKTLALTNFDTQRLELFVVREKLPIASNQVQFSLIDMRPARKMAPFCEKHGVKLLTYGTLAGGLLTDRYLGAPEPTKKTDLPTPSLGKYFNMIRAWGGWGLFQELLRACRKVADRHGNGTTIANVAVKWVLDQPAVGGVIVGLRAGLSEHAAENHRSLSLQFTDEDRKEISAVLAKGRDLMEVIGDCGDEYRG